MRWKMMSERHHGSIGGGADACGLNGDGDAEAGNLSDGSDGGMATEARMQRMELERLTLWFHRGNGREETNRPPRSPCLP